jgi:hypothetical protein
VLSAPYLETPGAGAAALARALTPCVDAWSLSLQWTMAQRGCGSSWLGRAKPEATDMEASLELHLSDIDDLAALTEDYRLQRYRMLVLGGSCYDGAAGEGAALVVPAAHLKEEPAKPDVGADNLRTRLVYGLGEWRGDETSYAATPPPTQREDGRLLNTLLRLGLG